jgi:hypothetical protein
MLLLFLLSSPYEFFGPLLGRNRLLVRDEPVEFGK